MPLLLQSIDGNREQYDEPIFDPADRSFSLKSKANENVKVVVRYVPPLIGTLGGVDFSVRLFKRHENSENDVFQVYDGEQNIRIGWLIPMTALESTEHD